MWNSPKWTNSYELSSIIETEMSLINYGFWLWRIAFPWTDLSFSRLEKRPRSALNPYPFSFPAFSKTFFARTRNGKRCFGFADIQLDCFPWILLVYQVRFYSTRRDISLAEFFLFHFAALAEIYSFVKFLFLIIRSLVLMY